MRLIRDQEGTLADRVFRSQRVAMRAAEIQCPHCRRETIRREGDSLRCACGSLLGRSVLSGLELKCRRCRRTVVLAWIKGEPM